MMIVLYRRQGGTLSPEYRDTDDGRDYALTGDVEPLLGWPTSAMRQAVIDGAEIPDVYLGTTVGGRVADLAAVAMGRRGGASKSQAKAAASQANGAKGGRPRRG